jgi:hypothetical protein
MTTTRPTKPEQLRAARLARHGEGADYMPASDGLTAVVLANKDNSPCAYGYRGRSMKSAFRYRFQDEDQRSKYVSDWLETANKSIAEWVALKDQRRVPHTLTVGDILVTSWGYDQTNVEFYEVRAVRGAAVDLQEVKADRKEHAPLAMQGTAMPRRGEYVGGLLKSKRPNGVNAVRIDSVSTARPWDGRPMSWSSYA